MTATSPTQPLNKPDLHYPTRQMGKQKKKEKNKTKKRNGAPKQTRNRMTTTQRLLAEAEQIVRHDQGRPNSIGALARKPPKGTGQRNVGGVHSSYMMKGGFKEVKDKSKEQIEEEKIPTGFRRITRHQTNRKDGHRSKYFPSPSPLVKAAQEAAPSTSVLVRAKLLTELETPAVDPHSNPNKPRSLRKTAIINSYALSAQSGFVQRLKRQLDAVSPNSSVSSSLAAIAPSHHSMQHKNSTQRDGDLKKGPQRILVAGSRLEQNLFDVVDSNVQETLNDIVLLFNNTHPDNTIQVETLRRTITTRLEQQGLAPYGMYRPQLMSSNKDTDRLADLHAGFHHGYRDVNMKEMAAYDQCPLVKGGDYAGKKVRCRKGEASKLVMQNHYMGGAKWTIHMIVGFDQQEQGHIIKVWITDSTRDRDVAAFLKETQAPPAHAPHIGGPPVGPVLQQMGIKYVLADMLGRSGKARYPEKGHFHPEIRPYLARFGVKWTIAPPLGHLVNFIEPVNGKNVNIYICIYVLFVGCG